MSKPGKISAETKKGACCYGIVTYSSTGWKSRNKRFVVGWGNSRQRQRQRRQERQILQKCSYLTTADGQLLYKEPSGNTTGRHFGLLQYLSLSSLVKWCLCSMERFPVRIVSFLRIIPLSEPHHGITVEQSDTSLLAVDL